MPKAPTSAHIHTHIHLTAAVRRIYHASRSPWIRCIEKAAQPTDLRCNLPVDTPGLILFYEFICVQSCLLLEPLTIQINSSIT